MEARFTVREHALGSFRRSPEGIDRLATGVSQVEMSSQHVDEIIARAIDRLGRVRYTQVQLAAPLAEHPVVGHALDQGMMERDRALRVVLAPVQETGLNQPVKAGFELRPVGRHRLQQWTAHHSPDDRPQLQCDCVARTQTIEAGGNDAFDGWWHPLRLPAGDRHPIAIPLRQRAGLDQRANRFLHKERIA